MGLEKSRVPSTIPRGIFHHFPFSDSNGFVREDFEKPIFDLPGPLRPPAAPAKYKARDGFRVFQVGVCC